MKDEGKKQRFIRVVEKRVKSPPTAPGDCRSAQMHAYMSVMRIN